MTAFAFRAFGLFLGLLASWSCSDDSESAADAMNPPGLMEGSTETTLSRTQPGPWQWVDDPEVRSASDTPSGYALRVGSDPGLLVVYMEEGGACFNAQTCALADNLDGYDAAKFNAEFVESGLGERGVFSTTSASNPLRGANFVFIPYTTGDVFAGTRPAASAAAYNFVGHANVGQALERAASDFPNLTRVLVTGSSAGACGTYLNFEAVRARFPSATVHLLSDSCPLLPNLPPALQARWRSTWGIAALPQGCSQCIKANGGGLEELPSYLASQNPASRFALVSSDRDAIMTAFFSFCHNGNSCNTLTLPDLVTNAIPFAQGLGQMRQNLSTAHPNWNFCTFANDTEHIHLLDGFESKACDSGELLRDFVARIVEP